MKSKVKVAARDVVASNVIIMAIKISFVLHIVYSLFWVAVLIRIWPTLQTFELGRVFVANAWWILPFLWICGPFYLFYFCPLMFEKLVRRWRLLPKYWLCVKSYFHEGEHPAELLRLERKKLVVRIQDLVHDYVKSYPEDW